MKPPATTGMRKSRRSAYSIWLRRTLEESHMKYPHVVQFSVQRLQCSACGAEANASCNCGKPYIPAALRVADYDKANPGRSTRQAAADLGVSHVAIVKARKSVGNQLPPETVTGRDGKTYKTYRLPKKPIDEMPADDGWTDAELEAEMGPLLSKEDQIKDDFIYLAGIAKRVELLDLTGITITRQMRNAAKATAEAWAKIEKEISRG